MVAANPQGRTTDLVLVGVAARLSESRWLIAAVAVAAARPRLWPALSRRCPPGRSSPALVVLVAVLPRARRAAAAPPAAARPALPIAAGGRRPGLRQRLARPLLHPRPARHRPLRQPARRRCLRHPRRPVADLPPAQSGSRRRLPPRRRAAARRSASSSPSASPPSAGSPPGSPISPRRAARPASSSSSSSTISASAAAPSASASISSPMPATSCARRWPRSPASSRPCRVPPATMPAARDRFLQIMHDQATRMSRLIDDLMSLSRIEMKAHVRPVNRVDLVAVVRHVTDALEPLAQELGVAIETVLPDAPVELTADRDELIQVFENLIENACKYGQSGERVVVTLTPADADGARPQRHRARFRPRHSRGARSAPHRALLSRRCRGQPAPSRHRPRAGHRQAHPRPPPRPA